MFKSYLKTIPCQLWMDLLPMSLLEFIRMYNNQTMLLSFSTYSFHPIGLNMETKLLTVIIDILDSSMVQILYSGCINSTSISTTTLVCGKFLDLHGEGGSMIGLPDLLIVPFSLYEGKYTKPGR